jgi:regulator of ribonuclease activity A
MSFSTADLCDKHGDRVKVLQSTLLSYGGIDSFKGEIVTIKLDEDNSDLVSMLRDEKGEGRVVVVDVEANYCAVVGDTLMGFAKKNGWAGIIINGFVRDIKITRTIPIGLMALGTCPRKSQKKSSSKRGIELSFGGVSFSVGEFIYVDEDGVILLDKILE